MYARDDTQTTDRTDPDHREPSPSTGAEATARILDARAGYDHETPAVDPDPEPVTIDATRAEEDERTDADAAREVSA